jgi:hypothetical protein
MIFDFGHRTIYVIEVARTGDSPGSLRNSYLKKTLKYAPIVEGLRKAFTPCKVEQITLVVGLLGSIEESRWRQSLESFGMTKFQDGQPPGHVALMLEAPGEEAVSFLITPGERVFCLLVLNLVSSTLSCIRQTRQQLRVLDVCGFV